MTDALCFALSSNWSNTLTMLWSTTSIIKYICLTQIRECDPGRWYEAHGFQVPTVAACVTAERRAPHYIRLLSKPTLMKASWLQHRWQMQGGQPVMLIFVYAIQQVIIKVRGWGGEWGGVQSLGDSLSWLKGSGWLSVVYVLLLHTQASMLISPHSCCYTRTGEASPRWFMSCQGRGLASCLTSERESRYPERAVSGPSWPHGASPDDRMAFWPDLISIHRKTCHATLIRR